MDPARTSTQDEEQPLCVPQQAASNNRAGRVGGRGRAVSYWRPAMQVVSWRG